MTRLSSIAGDYTQSGMIVDRQQHVADGGEDNFDLTFIEGSEEVYVDGSRLFKGADQDYTTGVSKIYLNDPLTVGQKIILIGRASSNEIPYKRAVSESVVIEDGQEEVTFQSIETEALEVYVSGVLVDRGRLVSPADYELKPNSVDTIILKNTFPAGTIIEGVQGDRMAWLNADNLVVNDGTESKSLSYRFSRIKESDAYFKQTHGCQLQNLSAGIILTRWYMDPSSVEPVMSASGEYPTLRIGNSYWYPDTIGLSGDYQVNSWNISGKFLNVSVTNVDTLALSTITYKRNLNTQENVVLTSPNGTKFTIYVDDQGNLSTTSPL